MYPLSDHRGPVQQWHNLPANVLALVFVLLSGIAKKGIPGSMDRRYLVAREAKVRTYMPAQVEFLRSKYS